MNVDSYVSFPELFYYIAESDNLLLYLQNLFIYNHGKLVEIQALKFVDLLLWNVVWEFCFELLNKIGQFLNQIRFILPFKKLLTNDIKFLFSRLILFLIESYSLIEIFLKNPKSLLLLIEQQIIELFLLKFLSGLDVVNVRLCCFMLDSFKVLYCYFSLIGFGFYELHVSYDLMSWAT